MGEQPKHRLTEAELDELLKVFGPSLRLSALVSEVREHRRKEQSK
jgi:hypothetical protein